MCTLIGFVLEVSLPVVFKDVYVTALDNTVEVIKFLV